jgi:hypothetical protein
MPQLATIYKNDFVEHFCHPYRCGHRSPQRPPQRHFPDSVSLPPLPARSSTILPFHPCPLATLEIEKHSSPEAAADAVAFVLLKSFVWTNLALSNLE